MHYTRSRARAARIFSSIAVVAALAASHAAGAADIFECKGANGVTSFQNEPCAPRQKTMAHGSYQREPDAPSSYQPPPGQYQGAEPMTRTRTGAVIAAPGDPSRQQATVAYQCTAGDRRWVQYSPCPATYMHGIAVDGLNGQTDNGQHVTNGSGWAQVQSPVDQQSMTSQQLCAQLGDGGARIPHSGQSDVYERNVAKRKYCGQ